MNPNDPSLDLAYDHVQPALDVLALEDGPLKARLIEAWNSHLSRLDGVELHPNLAKRFGRIRSVISRQELAIDAIEQLTLKEAQDLAFLVVDFARDLEMQIGARKR